MNRPIYRHLAQKEWHSYRRPLVLQRITQMSVVPDILPHIDPTVEVQLFFGRRKIQPGSFVNSSIRRSSGLEIVEAQFRIPLILNVISKIHLDFWYPITDRIFFCSLWLVEINKLFSLDCYSQRP